MFVLDLDKVVREIMDEYRPEFEATASGGEAISAFQPRAIVLHADGGRSVVPVGFHDAEEKRHKMQALALTCKLAQPMAVALLMDTIAINSSNLPSEFQWTEKRNPTPSEVRAVKKRVEAWLKKHYGGRVANMPQELRVEFYQCAIKGPGFPDQGVMQRYHKEGKRVVWEGEPVAASAGLFSMLPNWWEPLDPVSEAIAEVIRATSGVRG